MMRLKRAPDFEQFLKAVWRKGKPDYIPFYEHLASPGFIARLTETSFDKMKHNDDGYWQIYVDFWLNMGYDCIPMEIGLNCPTTERHALTESSEAHVVIRSWEDFENYSWPPVSEPINFKPFEIVAKLLPDGAKIVAGVGMGPFEWASRMLGFTGLSYALIDNPGLVDAVFNRLGKLITSADSYLADMESVCALRQGDDLGFKTSTFLSPNYLRKFVLPIYKGMAAIAHRHNKPFILHSCGNLSEIYDDLIHECKIDAKHSFEDTILSVIDFKKQYGNKITTLGGLDVDVICRSTQEDLKKYTRKNIEKCFYDGWWALGTGNSLTDYMPVDNYLCVLNEARNI